MALYKWNCKRTKECKTRIADMYLEKQGSLVRVKLGEGIFPEHETVSKADFYANLEENYSPFAADPRHLRKDGPVQMELFELREIETEATPGTAEEWINSMRVRSADDHDE